ncbi:MAG: hypothetical protein ABII90_06485 [Bacteroidota bacterium]
MGSGDWKLEIDVGEWKLEIGVGKWRLEIGVGEWKFCVPTGVSTWRFCIVFRFTVRLKHLTVHHFNDIGVV